MLSSRRFLRECWMDGYLHLILAEDGKRFALVSLSEPVIEIILEAGVLQVLIRQVNLKYNKRFSSLT